MLGVIAYSLTIFGQAYGQAILKGIRIRYTLYSDQNQAATMRINLRHFYCFREVARRNSINAASPHVHLSQPAITQAIAKLEVELGATLFIRRSSGMFVTEAGEIFLHRVKRALDYIEAGARETLKIAQKEKERGFENFHRLMTAAQLNALIAVVETGNFSLAARQTGVSQPSIHRRARDLESLSGVTLFEKDRSGIRPTATARILVRAAKLAFSEIELGRVELNALNGRETGKLTIGAMSLARAYILPKTLPAYGREFPDHRICIVDGPYDQLLSGLRHGDIDILIGAARAPAPIDDVVQEALFKDPLAIMMRQGHPLAKKKSATPKELAHYPWIVARAGAPLRARFEELFKTKRAGAPAQTIECNSFAAIRGLLLESDAVTLLSPHQAHYEIEAGLLTALPHPQGNVARDIAATVRSDWAPTRAQKRFMELLKTHRPDAA